MPAACFLATGPWRVHQEQGLGDTADDVFLWSRGIKAEQAQERCSPGGTSPGHHVRGLSRLPASQSSPPAAGRATAENSEQGVVDLVGPQAAGFGRGERWRGVGRIVVADLSLVGPGCDNHLEESPGVVIAVGEVPAQSLEDHGMSDLAFGTHVIDRHGKALAQQD